MGTCIVGSGSVCRNPSHAAFIELRDVIGRKLRSQTHAPNGVAAGDRVAVSIRGSVHVLESDSWTAHLDGDILHVRLPDTISTRNVHSVTLVGRR